MSTKLRSWNRGGGIRGGKTVNAKCHQRGVKVRVKPRHTADPQKGSKAGDSKSHSGTRQKGENSKGRGALKVTGGRFNPSPPARLPTFPLQRRMRELHSRGSECLRTPGHQVGRRHLLKTETKWINGGPHTTQRPPAPYSASKLPSQSDGSQARRHR